MTEPNTATQTQEQKPSDKELNFRKQEQMYQRMMAEKEAKIKELEKTVATKQQEPLLQDDDDDKEPYVDHKKLKKTLANFGHQTMQQTQSEIQKAVNTALSEERKQIWLKGNADFYDVMQHAEKFAQHDPELAETILQMPEGFERQKLVYKNIKALGLHKDKPKESSIQEKVDANRKSPYYQPSSVGAAPFAPAGDFSPTGQKNAYAKLQEMKSRLRI